MTCARSSIGSSIDVLTNGPKSFYNTSSIELGLSDCHKTFIEKCFKKLPHKNVNYRQSKIFDEGNFLHDFDHQGTKGTNYRKL